MPIKQIPVNAETNELIRNFHNNQILPKKKEFVSSAFSPSPPVENQARTVFFIGEKHAQMTATKTLKNGSVFVGAR
jgi:hypothetical protein